MKRLTTLLLASTLLFAGCSEPITVQPKEVVEEAVAVVNSDHMYFKDIMTEINEANDTYMFYAFDKYDNMPLLIAVDDTIANKYHYNEVKAMFDANINVIVQEPLCYEMHMRNGNEIEVTQRGTSYSKILNLE